jgi:hypothetical protein
MYMYSHICMDSQLYHVHVQPYKYGHLIASPRSTARVVGFQWSLLSALVNSLPHGKLAICSPFIKFGEQEVWP